jgi:hypothetical protein
MLLRNNEWTLEPQDRNECSQRLLGIVKTAWQTIPAEYRDEIVQGLRRKVPADQQPPGVPAGAVCILKLGLRVEIVPEAHWQALLKSRKFPPAPSGSTGIFSFISDLTTRSFPGRSVIVNEAIVSSFPDHAVADLLLHELAHCWQRALEMTGSPAFLEAHADATSERWGGGFSHDRGPFFGPGPRTALEVQRLLRSGRYTTAALRDFKTWNNTPRAAAFHGTGGGMSPTVTLEVSDSPISGCCVPAEITTSNICASIPATLTLTVLSGCPGMASPVPFVYDAGGAFGAGWYTAPDTFGGHTHQWYLLSANTTPSVPTVNLSVDGSSGGGTGGFDGAWTCEPFDSGNCSIASGGACTPSTSIRITE